MKFKTLQIYENRHPVLNTVKHVLALLVLSCLISSADAANTSFELYTDDDMKDAQETWSNSGFGKLIALIVLIANYTPYILLLLAALLAIVFKVSKNAEGHKGALQAIFWIIAIIFVLVIAIELITGIMPDISTIQMG